VTLAGGPPSRMSDPQVFTAAQIQHERPEQTIELSAQTVSVSIAATDEALRIHFISSPLSQIDMEIYRVNSAALPGPVAYDDDLYTDFKGVVSDVSFNDYVIGVSCVPLLLHEDRPIPRYYFQKTCNHQLFSLVGCKAVKALFETSILAASVNRVEKRVNVNLTSINVDSPTRNIVVNDGTFQSGEFLAPDGSRAMIVSSVASFGVVSLYLNWWPPDLAAGQTVRIYPGCARTVRACRELFDNQENFGGMPYIPVNNPAADGIST